MLFVWLISVLIEGVVHCFYSLVLSISPFQVPALGFSLDSSLLNCPILLQLRQINIDVSLLALHIADFHDVSSWKTFNWPVIGSME